MAADARRRAHGHGPDPGPKVRLSLRAAEALARVVAGWLPEAADLAREERGEAERREVLQVRTHRLETYRQPSARPGDREGRRRLPRQRGDSGVGEAVLIGHFASVYLEREPEIALVPGPGPLDVRIGEHVDGGG